MTRARDNSNILGTSGTNGQVLTIDTAQNNGYAFENPAQYAAGKNWLINGGFDIWQRNTTFTQVSSAGGSYGSADRWLISSYGTSAPTVTLTQSSIVPSSFPTIYSGAFTWNSTNSTGDVFLETRIENGKYFFAGQTATMSYWAKANSNVTVANGFDQDYATWVANITTTWQKFSYTFTFPANYQTSYPSGSAGNNNMALRILRNTNTGNASNTINVTGVQLELGSVATPFSRAGGTLQGELAACQRYYFRNTSQGLYGYMAGWGNAINSTAAYMGANLPVAMRVPPTAIDYPSLSFFGLGDGGSTFTPTSIFLDTAQTNNNFCNVGITVASGLTTNRSMVLRGFNTSSTYLGFSAEL